MSEISGIVMELGARWGDQWVVDNLGETPETRWRAYSTDHWTEVGHPLDGDPKSFWCAQQRLSRVHPRTTGMAPRVEGES